MARFKFQGGEFSYLHHLYNGTRINERAVEVPLALHLYGKSERTLEVGAVLPHYLLGWPQDAHEVIDLHERYPGVINADVLRYEPQDQYDLVLSVSTLDHLKSAEEVRTAVKRMKQWLQPDGLLFITLPHGQPPSIGGGPWLDKLVQEDALEMSATWRMDKVQPQFHLWEERSLQDEPRPYHGASRFANTVYLLAFSQHERGMPLWTT